MGLLDPTDDPRTMGLLSLGLGLMGARGNFGQALAQAGPQALDAMRQVKMDQQRAQQLKQQQELQALQLAEAQRQAMQRARMESLAQQFVRTPQQMALAQNGQGPTPANLQAAQTAAPGFDFQGYSNALAGIDPMAALNMQAALKKDDTPIALGEGGVLVTKTGKQLAANPKAPAMPSAVQEYQFAVSQGYKGTFDQWDMARKQAAASRVNVAVDAGPKAFWSDYGKQAADSLFEERKGAQAAAGVLQSVQQIRQPAQGGAYQGTGAELKLGAAKALGALGMPYDAKTVANTEVFNAQANKFVLESIKQLGANPSNADREFIEKTVPRLSTDPAALPLLLSFIEGKAQAQIRGFNSKAKSVASKPGAQFLPFDLTVQEPSSVVDFRSLN